MAADGVLEMLRELKGEGMGLVPVKQNVPLAVALADLEQGAPSSGEDPARQVGDDDSIMLRYPRVGGLVEMASRLVSEGPGPSTL